MSLRGWGWTTGSLAVLVAAGGLYSFGRPAAPSGPVALPNPNAQAPEVREVRGVRHVLTTQPAEQIVVDSATPSDPVRLLWFQGRTAIPTARGAIVLDGAAAPIRFDARLRSERFRLHLDGREVASVAIEGDSTIWVATREGSILRVGADGAAADSVTPAFDYSHLLSDPRGRVWAIRSPEQFAFPFRMTPEPLIAAVGHSAAFAVAARQPAVALFIHLVNAGRAAFGPDGSMYFAPFIRDEIIRFGPEGDTVWVASRGLPHGVEEPTFELDPSGAPLLDYAPVNLGLQFGPDGMLYVLSTPGFTTSEARLDVIDPASGIVRRTATMPSLPSVAVTAAGRVHLLNDFRLLTGVAPAEREALQPFDLERMGGGRITLAGYAGRVVLVNFWASWCAPCRDEMPALDSLAAEFADEPFAFVALSDDVDSGKARAFIEEFGFDFPVGLGHGKLRPQYHYIGLPFTVLVDAHGRIIQRWSGYAGGDQIAQLRAVIGSELDRLADVAPVAPGHEGHH
ncbi:MAG TPA: TlpA disulfide reductase family protein [Gemmatimonadales bacterium]